MGGLIESLKRNRRQFLIAGIELQFTTKEDEKMYSRKELESKSIKELTEIHNKLVSKNDAKATFRDKQKAVAAVLAAEKSEPKAPAAKVAPAALKKAAGVAAGEIEKGKRAATDTSVWRAAEGNHRFNVDSFRSSVFRALQANKSGMTLNQLKEEFPKEKAGKILAALNKLKVCDKATSAVK